MRGPVDPALLDVVLTTLTVSSAALMDAMFPIPMVPVTCSLVVFPSANAPMPAAQGIPVIALVPATYSAVSNREALVFTSTTQLH